jgi:hypothetical protein
MTVIAACYIFDLGVHYFGWGEGHDEGQFRVRCYTSSDGYLEYRTPYKLEKLALLAFPLLLRYAG